jgi:hypothetical protein
MGKPARTRRGPDFPVTDVSWEDVQRSVSGSTRYCPASTSGCRRRRSGNTPAGPGRRPRTVLARRSAERSSCFHDARDVRAAYRDRDIPALHLGRLGFRCARVRDASGASAAAADPAGGRGAERRPPQGPAGGRHDSAVHFRVAFGDPEAGLTRRSSPEANVRRCPVGIIETSAALGACLLVLTVAVALDRRPYRPGKRN